MIKALFKKFRDLFKCLDKKSPTFTLQEKELIKLFYPTNNSACNTVIKEALAREKYARR